MIIEIRGGICDGDRIEIPDKFGERRVLKVKLHETDDFDYEGEIEFIDTGEMSESGYMIWEQQGDHGRVAPCIES